MSSCILEVRDFHGVLVCRAEIMGDCQVDVRQLFAGHRVALLETNDVPPRRNHSRKFIACVTPGGAYLQAIPVPGINDEVERPASPPIHFPPA